MGAKPLLFCVTRLLQPGAAGWCVLAQLSSLLMTANLYRSGRTRVCGSLIFPPQFIVLVKDVKFLPASTQPGKWEKWVGASGC